MDVHDHTRKLPAELLSMIFDELCLDDILKSSHVSRVWRSVARGHPFYWRDIRIASLSTTALDFFHDRLDSGSDRTISVCLSFPDVAFPDRLRSVVLPAVVHNMERIRKLAAKFPRQCDSDVFGILCTPAPQLKVLDVYVVDDTNASSAFPSDLFANHAPNFTSLRIYNVQLEPPRLPPAIIRLETLKYYASITQAFPTALLSHCTNLKKLSIFGRYSPISPVTSHGYTATERRLQALEVGVFSNGLDILHSFPCASIPQVSIPLKRDAAANFLLGNLRGPLHLRLEHTKKLFCLEYASSTAGVRRTFIQPYQDATTLTIPEPYTTNDLLSRVQSVTVSTDCVPLLAALRALPACVRIAVSAAGHPLALPKAAVAVPKLEALELECDGEYDDADVPFLFDAMVAQAKNPVRVCLTDDRGWRELSIAPRGEPCVQWV